MCLAQNKKEPPPTIVVPIEQPVKMMGELLAESMQTSNSRIGNYQIVERLGSGGMGEVFRAVHVWLGREVAIKRMRPEKLCSAEAVKWFLDEVRTAALVDNPFVVRAYDAGIEDDYHYLVMELVDGIDLHTHVETKGPLNTYEALRVAAEVAMGLAHLEKIGLVHRDIKPTNLIRSDKTGSVKLLDLGLAQKKNLPFGNEKRRRFLTGGELLGTPDFMAPEQAIDATAVDIRSDIYSLGCTLYYLLSGQVPFPGGSAVRKVLCQYGEAPRKLSELLPDIQPRVLGIIERMMAKNPEDRQQNPKQLLEELAPALFDEMNELNKLAGSGGDWEFWLKQLCKSITLKNRYTAAINAR